jgi:hypothetical protein
MPIKTKEEGRTEATLDDAAHALFPRVHETGLDSAIQLDFTDVKSS